jgi:glutathione S-transferase
MILIGQYDSPFVRRVGVALSLYGLPFRHEPWSVFGDVDRLRPINPLTRVPTLIQDDGVALTDSHLIIGYIDGLVGASRALWPHDPVHKAHAFRITGLAMGAADKAVSAFYEIRLHEAVSEAWLSRCMAQMLDALQAMEDDRAARTTDFWFGADVTHADIAAAVAFRFIGEVHGTRHDLGRFDALRAFSERMEALPVMRRISQPFIAPT